jgi:hypothetical protein
MSELRSRGVKCKNPECPQYIEIDRGYELTGHNDTILNWPPAVPPKITCPKCLKEYEYSQSDLERLRIEG